MYMFHTLKQYSGTYVVQVTIILLHSKKRKCAGFVSFCHLKQHFYQLYHYKW